MITEDYVSYEVAKLLKEKGFEQHNPDVEMYYRENGEYSAVVGDEVYWIDSMYACPTLQMAMKWLREVHKYLIVVGNKNGNYLYLIKDLKANTDLGISNDKYIRYEEACEEAIKYCLENLI